MNEQMSIFDLIDEPLQIGEKVYFATCDIVVAGVVENLSPKPDLPDYIAIKDRNGDINYVPRCRAYRNKESAVKEIRRTWKDAKIKFE